MNNDECLKILKSYDPCETGYFSDLYTYKKSNRMKCPKCGNELECAASQEVSDKAAIRKSGIVNVDIIIWKMR